MTGRLSHLGVGALICVGWLVVTIIDLNARDPLLLYSGASAMQAALVTAILMWPVTAGVAAAVSVRSLRRRPRELVLALPDRARIRVVLAPALVIGAWAVGGLLVSVVATQIVSGGNGSIASPVSLLALPTAIVGTFAVVLFGTAVGVFVPSWTVPPLVLAGIYLSYVMSPVAGSDLLFEYAGMTASLAPSLVPEVGPVFALVGVLLMLAAALWAGASARLTGHRGLFVGAGALVVLGLGGLSLVSSAEFHRLTEPGEWACAQIDGSQSSACVPREQSRDLAHVVAAMKPLDERWRGAAGMGAQPIVYGPNGSGLAVFEIPVPFGQLDDFEIEAARMVVSQTMGCFGSDFSAMDEAEWAWREEAYVGLLGWLAPDAVEVAPWEEPVPPLSDRAVAEVLALAEGCTGGIA